MHFRMPLEAIFEHPEDLVWNITFTRIALNPDYNETLCDGIRFFVLCESVAISLQHLFLELGIGQHHSVIDLK